MYGRILVPVDGSPTSNRGLTEAINLAKDQKAKLRLLHAIDESFLVYDAYGMVSWDSVTRSLREGGEKLMAEAKSLAARNGITLHELSPQQASLEEAFFELTDDSVDYHGGDATVPPTTPEAFR